MDQERCVQIQCDLLESLDLEDTKVSAELELGKC